jgi:oligoendopeptidase F
MGRALGSYVWDLSSLYSDRKAWDDEREAILRKIDTIEKLRGTGKLGAQAFADELDAVADLRSRAAKMAIYGFLVSSVDDSPNARSQYDVGTGLRTAAESAVAFLPQDVLAIGEPQLKAWLREEPRLARHRVRILRILREAPHTLPPEVQAAVTSMDRWPQTSYDVWSILGGLDLGWPSVKSPAGEEISLTFNHLVSEFQGQAQVDAYPLYLRKLRSLEDLYALLLTRRIEADLTIARHQKFKNGIDALWFREDGMPEGTQQIMLNVARDNIGTLRRYLRLRGRSLGLNHLSYAELGLDPPALTHQFSIAEAMEIAEQVSTPFGEDYQQRLRLLLTKKWMHLPPWRQKASSYGIYPPVAGIPPFFVMSYHDDYESARRFVGGVTLMMSDVDIPQKCLPDNWDDAGIYGNGIIYLGDMLFDDYLVKNAKDRREKIADLVNALDFDYKYFQYVLWAKLDSQIQQQLIDGKTPPNGREITETYLEMLRQYFGTGPTEVVEDVYGAEWMTNHLPFGNYQYQLWPPALAMSAQVVEQMGLHPERNIGLKVVDLLGRSDFDRTYQMLNEVGVDLAKSEPYLALVHRMNRQLDELEALLNERPFERF